MKINIYLKGLTAVAVAGLLASCSSDYLDLAPETDVATDQVAATTEAAALAINGIANAMQTQYGGMDYNNMNGESYINTIFGEGFGQDDQVGLCQQMFGNEIVCGGSPWGKDNYVMNVIIWKYCYNLIKLSNVILDGIDEAEGSEADRQFIKAQALTFRAHGYTKLMQYYAPRWQDSRNGEAYCAVYRVNGSTEDAPLCTENEVMELIYNDLNTAIDLYKASGRSRVEKWHPDLNVAYGILARAALIKNDFATAQEAAHNARQGYPIMDNNTYLAGFVDDNASIMWTQTTDPSSIYYWSFGAHNSVNGAYTESWGLGAGAIDYDFYKTLDEKDIRRQMYLTPDKIEVLNEVNSGWNPGKLTAADWWNKNLVLESSHCDLSKGPYAKKDAKNGKWGLYNVAVFYSKYYGENIFSGDYESMNNEGFNSYFTSGNSGDLLIARGTYATLCTTPFGAQYKFWSIPPYGTSAFPFMRAEEMCMIEAEAAYHNGDAATALSCLKEIQTKRIPGYAFAGSGEDLLNEIRKCRRIELWGEGFSFTDFKRWNLDIVRKAWIADDPESGNWMGEFAYTTKANSNGGWRMLVPASEFNYNSAIDRNLLEYTNDPNVIGKQNTDD